MTSCCRALARFAVFARTLWRNDLFWKVEYGIVSSLFCGSVKCEILQDMVHMEATCVSYINVGTLNWLEQSKHCVLTDTRCWIAMLTIKHHMLYSVCFMSDPGNLLNQTSAALSLVEEYAVYILYTWDFSSCSHLFLTRITHTLSVRLGSNCRTVGNPYKV
jgi:hypothetical protein